MAPATPPDETAAPAAVDDHGPRQVVFSPRELAFLIGVPLLWALLLLFYPGGEGQEIYLDAQDEVTRFLVVHVGMMFFIPLMAVAVYLLVDGVEEALRRSAGSRLCPLSSSTAWEALQGIGVGILVDEVNGLPQAERDTGAACVQGFAEHALIADSSGVFVVIGSLAFITATTAAGIALHRHAGAPRYFPFLLGFAAAPHHGPSPSLTDPPGSSFSSSPCCSTCEAVRDPPTS